MAIHSSKLVLSLSLLVAACGGADIPPTPPPPTPPVVPVPTSYPGIFDTTSTDTSRLGVHALNSTALTANGSNGSLDRSANTVTILGLPGSINSSRTTVTLNGGGTVDITNSGMTYVAMFQAQPTGSSPSTGVLGVETHISTLPTGSASYAGASQLQAIDGTSVYDLTGSSSAALNFASGRVNVTYANLTGSRTDGLSPPVSVSNVGTLSITGATMFGNTFSGGAATLNSTQLPVLSGNQVVTTSGGFYGPTANEIGGVNLVNDTTWGSLLLLGRFIGQ